jgi:hypothetical protein
VGRPFHLGQLVLSACADLIINLTIKGISQKVVKFGFGLFRSGTRRYSLLNIRGLERLSVFRAHNPVPQALGGCGSVFQWLALGYFLLRKSAIKAFSATKLDTHTANLPFLS